MSPDQPKLYKIKGVEGDFDVFVTTEFGVKQVGSSSPPTIEIGRAIPNRISESVKIYFSPQAEETISESAEVTIT